MYIEFHIHIYTLSSCRYGSSTGPSMTSTNELRMSGSSGIGSTSGNPTTGNLSSTGTGLRHHLHTSSGPNYPSSAKTPINTTGNRVLVRLTGEECLDSICR